MGILLGLATALCWGSADLFARFATRKIGTFRTMLYMQCTGFILLNATLPLLGGWGGLFRAASGRLWMWGICVGLLNTSSTLALYRSFEIGKMSIVAPLSASYPVLTLLLSLTTGEHLTAARLIGIALTILGVVLVAGGEKISDDANAIDEKKQPAKQRLGVGWALYAAAGFGVMFWLLGSRVVPLLGAAPTVWVIRLTSVFSTLVVILLLGQSLAPPIAKDSSWILAVGLLDTGAYVLNNFGMQREQVSVVSVLASLYGAITVALAALVLREPVSRLQWFGVVAIFAGIVLISR